MWVKSTLGHMHNLDRFDTISTDYTAVKKQPAVFGFAGDGARYLLGIYSRKEQAEQALTELFGAVEAGCKTFSMPVYNW